MAINLTAQDGHTLSAYVSGSSNAARALVLVQEIFGVNDHIRNVADSYARQGYYVIAPALFDRAERNVELGYTQDDVKAGLDLRARIPLENTLMDLQAATDFVGGRRKVGMLGFCWGGMLAWLCATRGKGLAAAVAWYGGGIAQYKDEAVQIPVQMHFGEKDGAIPLSDVEAIRAAQPAIEIFVYQDAGHGFGCDHRSSFNAEATALARDRSLGFLAQHLGEPD